MFPYSLHPILILLFKSLDLRVGGKSIPLHEAFGRISNTCVSCLPCHPSRPLPFLLMSMTRHPHCKPSCHSLKLLVLPPSWPFWPASPISPAPTLLRFYIIHTDLSCFSTVPCEWASVTHPVRFQLQADVSVCIPIPFPLQHLPSVSSGQDLSSHGMESHPLELFSCSLPGMASLLPFTHYIRTALLNQLEFHLFQKTFLNSLSLWVLTPFSWWISFASS